MTTVAGRFAPSPTGPLHMGSLLAATASFLHARAAGGLWYLRIDDLDPPRSVPGSEASILRSLEAHGLLWDGPVVRQSERLESYTAALEELIRKDLVFYCTCSRKLLAGRSRYPGTCRAQRSETPDTAMRVETPEREISFDDLLRGPQHQSLATSIGDFIVKRRDGLFAYQLATAVDDGNPGITHVVRGSDLLDNTFRQIYLMQLLDLPLPTYAHVPTLVNAQGGKLSKHTHAPPLDDTRAQENLIETLSYLGMEIPDDLQGSTVSEVLRWGMDHWELSPAAARDQVRAR